MSSLTLEIALHQLVEKDWSAQHSELFYCLNTERFLFHRMAETVFFVFRCLLSSVNHLIAAAPILDQFLLIYIQWISAN